ncbi:hypothetical protein AVEN_160427-1 [Araneus ventricosus]|uniref:Uncharacterized protein n=1 Tax=Araneus ventricosus TaxID=182803 RepID=A0A4Y2Q653_ARAVE|nr:hypothetical protein AVEN_19807-1 [Araneus ventricosus]GBN61718.1 hypothetical protein AVEN_160427-1 [Araneus ventricosus]
MVYIFHYQFAEACFELYCSQRNKKKHVTLSIKDKVNLIKKLESGTAVAKLCEEYGLGRIRKYPKSGIAEVPTIPDLRRCTVLEREELNIIDAMELIHGTIKSFQEMNNDTEINALVKRAICFAKKLHISHEDDYLKTHRLRHAPKKYDNNPEITCNVDLMTYYRKEFKAVLDVFASCVNDDLKNTLSVLEPYQKIFTLPANRNDCLIESVKSIESHPEIFSEELECLHSELQMLLDSSESCSNFADI